MITGPSGSGKSSLAFDTIYAEGYRKYMESLSTQARQVLDQLKRPDVDFIHGLSPVLAIEQRTGGVSPRTTIATVTEVSDYCPAALGPRRRAALPEGRRPRRAALARRQRRTGSSPSARASGSCCSRPSSGRSRASCATSCRGCASAGSSGCGSAAQVRELDEPDLDPVRAPRRSRSTSSSTGWSPAPEHRSRHRRLARARVPRGPRPRDRPLAEDRRTRPGGRWGSASTSPATSAATCSRS